jgi:hypothetical protein
VARFNLENKPLDQATSKVSPVWMFIGLVDFSRELYVVGHRKTFLAYMILAFWLIFFLAISVYQAGIKDTVYGLLFFGFCAFVASSAAWALAEIFDN